ncbi:N-acetylglucosamine-6-phosphate deacetylase [Desulfosporosinus sp. OT]|uniref:N-acetylglucosamine-6-phosphate deacetylase n=1 Tax=Desulfosporosinus sp. OT TaxID=913865 RepID=UPI000223AEE4|nr:N-acetylglucosamine-6-phosphate deacetylase [Desulfosporosinus sp. OT]EGW40421.1 N-acetylglucosamine-6-phosphate deacetylase [Desulfosporosinus sp. OT]
MDAIINGKIIIGNELETDKVIIFEDKIIDIIPRSEIHKYSINNLIDAKDNYVSSGFIDIHTHGAMGHDIMDGDLQGIRAICKRFVSYGVTGFLATTMTMDWDKIESALRVIKKAMVETSGSNVLGCHLEGPFISSKNPGAQNPIYMRHPDFELLRNYKNLIKVVTIAPELENTECFIRKCVDSDIVISLGHSCGTYEDAINAIENGARSITHTFNAMTPLNHREPGIVGAAMCSSEVYCELIVDNIHIHPAAQRILLQSKGIEKIILVTDSMRASGLGNGRYELGGQCVVVENNSARLEDGTLAGSILTIANALRNFKRNTGISIINAVKTVTENPAKLLGMEESIGHIGIGKRSDIVVFDDNFSILYTFVSGHLCYIAENT